MKEQTQAATGESAALSDQPVSYWESCLRYAEEYRRRYGNLNVPAKYRLDNGFSLGSWIVHLRGQYRAGQLAPERIAQLNALGMDWTPNATLWERRFAAAEAYYHAHGNLLVPNGYVTADGIKLGSWITALRKGYRGSGGAARPTPDQVRRLDAIGMRWNDVNEARWLENFARAKEYFADGHCLQMSVKYVTPDGVPLGDWLARQRRAAAAGSLPPERLRMLAELGVV